MAELPIKNEINSGTSSTIDLNQVTYEPPIGTICLDEVKEVICMTPTLKDYYLEDGIMHKTDESISLTDQVVEDLRAYVQTIAGMYRSENPFHNFEHACHVTMSVNKLLKRIVLCDNDNNMLHNYGRNNAEVLKDEDDVNNDNCTSYIHGLCCDPLSLFAIVFSALIHDVDHRGCSNAQLAQENVSLGMKYRYRSVAEQNSIDVAWNLFMDERFNRLRCMIFHCQNDLLRFRQVVINCVMATDIFDKEINDLRKNRWMKAFSDEAIVTASNQNTIAENLNRKSTIVLEHIIQASDVSHTMQHWHVYIKWNRLLFREMYFAYNSGRLKVNPQTFWYEGEIGFFDNYIIPLANKLKECHVFGVSSDEYYNYAINNRDEWIATGQDKLAEMILEIHDSSLPEDDDDMLSKRL